MVLFAAALAISVIFALLYAYLFNWSSRADERRAQFAVAGLVGTVTLVTIVYRALVSYDLDQTAALFVGLPGLLAIAAVFAPARSATGVAVKCVTIGLLVSLLFLWEGMLCVLMSAPLFYLVAIVIGRLVGNVNQPDDRGHLSSWIALFAILPMSFEGVTATTTIGRAVTISEIRIVNASAEQVEAALQQPPRFDRALPRYLSMGFPRPTMTSIAGSRWLVRMRGGEMRLNGMEPRVGDLILEREATGPRSIVWRATSDSSHVTHFLNWESSRVEWQAIDATHTRVTWTLRYRRGLDPAWYFGPMERYAAHLAAGYLIDAVATP